jgi:hypothetical protein
VTPLLGNRRPMAATPPDQRTGSSSASPMEDSNTTTWKAHVENKCKVFAWILVQEKNLTVDNLQKRGWPHQERCVLCDRPLETGLHLSPLCPFAKAVWNQVFTWEHFDSNTPKPYQTLCTLTHGGNWPHTRWPKTKKGISMEW